MASPGKPWPPTSTTSLFQLRRACSLRGTALPHRIAVEVIIWHEDRAFRSIPSAGRSNPQPQSPVEQFGRVAVAHVQGLPKGGSALSLCEVTNARLLPGDASMTRRHSIVIHWRCGVTALLLCGSLASCSPADQQKASEPPTKGHWRWKAGPAGSQISFDASVALSNGTRTSDRIARCWPQNRGYDCLSVVQMQSDSGSYFIASRFQSPSLVTQYSDISDTPGGYSCEFFSPQLNISEAVSNGMGTLRTNIVNLSGLLPHSRPWDAEETKAFMRSNEISPVSYFDCTEIASRILNASVAAVGSTDLDYAAVMK